MPMSQLQGYKSDDLPEIKSREDALALLTKVVKHIHFFSFFISGSITVDHKRTCIRCKIGLNLQNMIHNTSIPSAVRSSLCLKCFDEVKSIEPKEIIEPNKSSKVADLSLVPKALPPKGDQVLCDKCGSLCMRAGTCYVCTGCGTTTGCS